MHFRTGERSLDWEFTDPDTNFLYKANSKAELYKLILQYRINNRLDPIENLEMVIDNYLCHLPQNIGKCRPQIAMKRGLLAYYRGAILLLKNLLYGSIVSQEKADERAEVCIKCPNNIFPDRERYVRWADALAEGAVKSRKSKYHNELGNCSICTCCMRAKVWIGKDILELPKEELGKMPDFCWQKKEILEKSNG